VSENFQIDPISQSFRGSREFFAGIFMSAKSYKFYRTLIYKPLFGSILIVLLLLSLIPGYRMAFAGGKVVVAQSIKVAPYEEALKGFESVHNGKITKLVTSEMEKSDLLKKIQKIRPDLILAIGMDALAKTKMVKNIPVVYIMVLNPHSILSDGENISGISMNIPQEKQMGIVLEALPDLKTVGLLYDPDRTGELAKRAQKAAVKTGIKLIATEVHSSRDVPSLISNMKGRIDLFWMLPDITVLSPELIEFFFLFSFENRIPIITFSEKYLRLGALMSIGIDTFDIGAQAGEMAEEILSNGVNIKHVDARKAVVKINLNAAKKLGITIDEKIVKKFKIVD